MKPFVWALWALFALFFHGCIAYQSGNPSLTLFQNRGTIGVDHSSKELNPRNKVEQSCITSYFGLISLGDASAELAMIRGKMKQVESISHEWKTQYFFLQEFCTIVQGQ